MEKLSEAGRLYLADFQVLNKAYVDIVDYLDTIIKHVYANLEEQLATISVAPQMSWDVWENKSRPSIYVYPTFKSELGPFVTKTNIEIIYRDVRHDTRSNDSRYVCVYAYPTAVFKKNVKSLPDEIHTRMLSLAQENGLGTELTQSLSRLAEIKLDLDSASESADEIVRVFIGAVKGVNEIIGLFQE